MKQSLGYSCRCLKCFQLWGRNRIHRFLSGILLQGLLSPFQQTTIFPLWIHSASVRMHLTKKSSVSSLAFPWSRCQYHLSSGEADNYFFFFQWHTHKHILFQALRAARCQWPRCRSWFLCRDSTRCSGRCRGRRSFCEFWCFIRLCCASSPKAE